MAMSSIFENVEIKDPKKAKIFIDALDASADEIKEKPSTSNIPIVSDVETIQKLMKKRVSTSTTKL